MEEIKWSMIDSNQENEDLLFDIWDSLLYENPNNWEISGLDLEIPSKGDTSSVRIKFIPIDLMMYTGNLSFKTILSNEIKDIKSISNVVKNTMIGTVENNQSTTLRKKIEEKNINSKINWSQVTLSNITNTDVTLEAIKNSLYYKGAVNINFKIGKQLTEVIKNIDLGKIEENVTDKLILKILKIKNINVLTDQLSVSKINLENGTALIKPLNDYGEYVGQVEVKFVNSKHISSIIKKYNLGSFTNPTKTALVERIVSLNPLLKRDDFVIDSKTLTYNNVNIIATSNSKYHGQVSLSFFSNLTTGLSYDSGRRRVDAYATTYKEIKTDYLYYTPEFGKEALLKRYSKINFSTVLNAWFNAEGKGQLSNSYKDFSIDLSSNTGTKEFYNASYTNVNWMKVYSSVSYSWSGNKITFKVITAAEAFASGWNAAWARAEARTQINSIWFS